MHSTWTFPHTGAYSMVHAMGVAGSVACGQVAARKSVLFG